MAFATYKPCRTDADIAVTQRTDAVFIVEPINHARCRRLSHGNLQQGFRGQSRGDDYTPSSRLAQYTSQEEACYADFVFEHSGGPKNSALLGGRESLLAQVKSGEFREQPDRPILSQAAAMRTVQRLGESRRTKRSEAPDLSQESDEIV